MIKLVRFMIIVLHSEKIIHLWNKFFTVDYLFSSNIFGPYCREVWLEWCSFSVQISTVEREIPTVSLDVIFFNGEKDSDHLTIYFIANSNIIVTYITVSNCYSSLINKLDDNYLKYHIINQIKMIQIRSILVERVVY